VGFKVGEKIVYPNHGVSVVEKIGEGFATEPVAPRSFYHLRLLSNNSRVMVPVGNTDLIGLRRLVRGPRGPQPRGVVAQRPVLGFVEVVAHASASGSNLRSWWWSRWPSFSRFARR